MSPWCFPRAPRLCPLPSFLPPADPSFRRLRDLTGPHQSLVSYSTARWFRRKLEKRGRVQPGLKRASRSQWLAQVYCSRDQVTKRPLAKSCPRAKRWPDPEQFVWAYKGQQRWLHLKWNVGLALGITGSQHSRAKNSPATKGKGL